MNQFPFLLLSFIKTFKIRANICIFEPCTSHTLFYLFCVITPWVRHYSRSHYTDEKVEVLKSQATCLTFEQFFNRAGIWTQFFSFFRTQIYHPHCTLLLSVCLRQWTGILSTSRSEQKIAVSKSQLWQSCGETSILLRKWRLCKSHQALLEEPGRVLQRVQ